MINIVILENNIELLREKLYSLLSIKTTADIAVIKCSQELDKLIAEYEKACLNHNCITENIA